MVYSTKEDTLSEIDVDRDGLIDQIDLDVVGESELDLPNIDVKNFSGYPLPNSDLSNSSIDVAGNTVSLGGSTIVDYTDLNDTGASFPIPNSDLSNSEVTVAGNSVSLGNSTNVDYIDLNDTGASFPIPNSDLSNSSIDVAGNSVNLGGSTSVAYGDLSDTGSYPITNTDLNNSSITVGSTSISLGSSGTPDILNLDGSSLNSGEYVKFDGNGLVSSNVSTSTPDGDTIVKNQNGNIEVSKPATAIISSLSNVSSGRTETATVDLTNYDKLIVPITITVNNSYQQDFEINIGGSNEVNYTVASNSTESKTFEVDVSGYTGSQQIEFTSEDPATVPWDTQKVKLPILNEVLI